MANLETQLIDDLIVKGRRKMMAMSISSMAGLFMAGAATTAEAQTATYTDNDILNFALNLEYLEANFYYLAAFGTTIDKPNAASMAAGGPTAGIPITISGGVGTAGTVSATGATKVPFATVTVGSYAVETAIEEGKHVLALQKALGSAAVNQPAINLGTGATDAFPTLATAAGVAGGATFSPYTTDANFLVGAYVFEDVGVTAYHGAASLLTGTTTTLPVAAGILAVEAYHAGLIRTTINNLDPTNTAGYLTITQQISTLRAALAKKGLLGVAPTASQYDSDPDDFGLPNFTVSLAGAAAVPATRITDADATNVVAFSRNTTQVLNIVTGGGAVNAAGTAAVSPAKGVFFPAGLNGLFK
jgi:hypothetical protein